MPKQHSVALKIDPLSLALHFQFPFSEENISLHYITHLSLSSPEETQKYHHDHEYSLEWILEKYEQILYGFKIDPKRYSIILLCHLASSHCNCISLPTILESKMEQGKNKFWSKVYTGTTHALIFGSLRFYLFCAKTTSLLRHDISDASHCHQEYAINPNL